MPSRTQVPDDPVEKEYDVYISPFATPAVSTTTTNSAANPTNLEVSAPASSTYLLQHPTRSRRKPLNAQHGCSPTAARIKPTAGFLELDVPICPDFNYNREKAGRWGRGLGECAGIASGAVVSGNSVFGMANGFVGPNALMRARLRARKVRDVEVDGDVQVEGTVKEGDSDGEKEEGQPFMNSQVMGGKIMKSGQGSPVYMIGVYRGDELHLTPLTGLAQLRPQFHHLDAQSYLSRLPPRTAQASVASVAAAAPQPAPRMVHLSHHRPSTYGDFQDTGGRTLENDTRELLGRAAEENWIECAHWDEDEDVAYQAYSERLFSGKSKGPEEELLTEWSREVYLNEISRGRGAETGPKTMEKKRPLPQVRGKTKGKGKARVDRRTNTDADGDVEML